MTDGLFCLFVSDGCVTYLLEKISDSTSSILTHANLGFAGATRRDQIVHRAVATGDKIWDPLRCAREAHHTGKQKQVVRVYLLGTGYSQVALHPK